jgi:hypothetical protein
VCFSEIEYSGGDVSLFPRCFSVNIVGIFRKLPDVFFFPQLWKSFSTIVVNVFYNCGKAFPQLWKERNIGMFTEKHPYLNED